MVRVLLSGFLIAHGLVHIAIWAPKHDPEKAPFDASHSWLIVTSGRSRRRSPSPGPPCSSWPGSHYGRTAGGGGRPRLLGSACRPC
jgi:hypothetical protein